MNELFKKEITIHDKDGKRFDLKITNEGCGGSPYFSICSQSGQGQFNPKGELQGRLLDIWNTYHLDGMSAGTKKQMDILKSYKDGTLEISELMKQYLYEEISFNKLDSYGINRLILVSTNKDGKLQVHSKRILDSGENVLSSTFNIMYNKSQISEIEYINAPQDFYDGDIRIKKYIPKDVTMLYDGDYEYGTGWIYKDFPDNFQEDLFKLIDDLIDEEDEYNERKITIEDIDNEEFIEHANENCEGEVEKLMAACLYEGVSRNGLENVTCNGTYWDIEGFEYYIYTDEEADVAHEDSIQSWVDDLGFEGFNKNNLSGPYVTRLDNGNIKVEMYIEIPSYERGNALAWYDGNENEVVVNGTTYYLYRNN